MRQIYFEVRDGSRALGTQVLEDRETKQIGPILASYQGGRLVVSSAQGRPILVPSDATVQVSKDLSVRRLATDRDFSFWSNKEFLQGLYENSVEISEADEIEVYDFSGLQWFNRRVFSVDRLALLRRDFASLPADWNGSPWASGEETSDAWSLVRAVKRAELTKVTSDKNFGLRDALRVGIIALLALLPLLYLYYMSESLPDPKEDEKPVVSERFVKLKKPKRRVGSLRSKKGAGARRIGKEGKRSAAQKAAKPGESKKVDVNSVGLLSVFRSDATAKVSSEGKGVKVGGIRQASGILKNGTSAPGKKGASAYGLKGDGAGGGGTSLVGVGLADHGQGLAESGTGTGFVDSNGASAVGIPGDEALVMDGGLDPSVIRSVIRRHYSRIRACYEAVLQSRPGLQGKVRMAFTILGSGVVSGAKVAESSLGSSKAHSCITQVFSGMQFPKPVGGVKVPVRYPFSFQASR